MVCLKHINSDKEENNELLNPSSSPQCLKRPKYFPKHRQQKVFLIIQTGEHVIQHTDDVL